MPTTREEHKRSLRNPAMCELLPIRDFLDNVMIRTDGSYVAGFRLSGALMYFADDEGRNEAKELIESLLRTVPEQSMIIQFRYEVVEGLNGLLDRYEDHRRTESPEALVLERLRMRQWQEKESVGEYLTRFAAVYLIWDSEKHRRLMAAAGGQSSKNREKTSGFSLSVRKCIERTKKEHTDALAEFESIVNGVESSLKRAAMGPERMTHEELFLEIKRALNPNAPDATRLRRSDLTERYVSAREQAATVSILGDAENYINVDGVLWSIISLKTPPDGTYPGIIRNLLTAGFPLVISTQITIPDQRAVLDKYKKLLKKMQAAQIDSKGGQRVDIEAQVATQELMNIQAEILASSVKTAKVSLTIVVRTSRPAFTSHEYEIAERELSNRRQQILHIVSQMNGARAYGESLAQRRLLVSSMPGRRSLILCVAKGVEMRIEHTLPNDLLGHKPVRVMVVGAGGTGSAIVIGLPYLDQAMRVWGRSVGLDNVLMDADTVSETNCVRQPFAVSNIGQNKATVLINRINLFWGMRWRAEPANFDDRTLDRIQDSSLDLLIGCVDTRAARRVIEQALTKARNRTAYWLDLGNNAASGQFVLGQPLNGRKRRKAARLRTVSELFPEITDAEAGEDPLPSCSAVEALDRQEPFINQTLASSALAMLARLLRYGKLIHHGGFFNAQTGQMTALPVDTNLWSKTRRRNRRS